MTLIDADVYQRGLNAIDEHDQYGISLVQRELVEALGESEAEKSWAHIVALCETTLRSGSHAAPPDPNDPKAPRCAEEVVAWLAGLGHTDSPSCASPVLRAYTIRLNDRWDDEKRQTLKPYLIPQIGTGSDGKDDARRALAARVLATELVGPWLRLAGLDADADKIAALADDVPALRSALWAAQDRAWAKRRGYRDQLAAEIRKHLTADKAAAAEAAAAAAVAAAEAAAVAAAEAAAEAVAAAAAAVAVVAAEAAAAAAVAVVAAAVAAEAVAAVAAAAEAVADPDRVYGSVYTRMRGWWRTWYTEAPEAKPIRDLAAAQDGVALQLLGRLIDPDLV